MTKGSASHTLGLSSFPGAMSHINLLNNVLLYSLSYSVTQLQI